MTQSGQGEEPSARPAHEGIVLPSDGGEPLLPGMTAAPAPAEPAGGQSWGGAWGPGHQEPQPQPGQGWPPAAAQQWGTPEQQPVPGGPGPLPPEGAPAAPYGEQSYRGQSYGGQSYGGQSYDSQAYGAPADQYQQQQQYPAQGAPPPADGATRYLPPVPATAGPAPGYPAEAEGATQYLPPVPAASADEGATQYIPPVTSGGMPPDVSGEQTRYPGTGAPRPAGHGDAEATQYIPPYAGQAEGGDQQPPAEFDNLFRGGPAGPEGPAGATQQMPRVQQPGGHPGHPGPARPPQPSYGSPADEDDGRRRPGRTGSRVPLIAAIGVGIVVLGFGVGALLSGGGGDDKGADGKTVAASSPAVRQSSSPAADPARQQAVALDKLLADSGSSRASVIQAVGSVRQCDNLGQSATDLRNAARQRTDLVTRLGKLSVDKLPANGELTAALTRAWQASAAADNHYAAWADQVGGRKGCHKGHARATSQTQAGNRESGTASAQKVKAAALWNAIARKYGLTQRQPTQL